MKPTNGVCDVLDLLMQLTDEDLDCVQANYVSNEYVDEHGPMLQQWFIRLLSEERDRRAKGNDTADLTIVDFSQWPTDQLVAESWFALECAEWTATAAYKPCLTALTFAVAKAMAAEAYHRLLLSAPA